MKIFNKDENEQLAIDYLKEYDVRYKNLIKSECPDFISEKDSIGVEITLVEFDDFINSFNYKGKTLKEYIRMKGIKPTQKKELNDINNIINGKYPSDLKDGINKFIDEFYYKKGDEILKLESIEQYKKLDPNTNLFSKSSFPNEIIMEGQRIICPLPSMFWTGQIVNKYIEAVKVKNQKLSHYKIFDENSLVLINYTAGLEETLDFEKRIKEIDEIKFDKIFVLNELFNKQIYEIDLRKS